MLAVETDELKVTSMSWHSPPVVMSILRIVEPRSDGATSRTGKICSPVAVCGAGSPAGESLRSRLRMALGDVLSSRTESEADAGRNEEGRPVGLPLNKDRATGPTSV